MKTIVPFKQNLLKFVLFVSVTASGVLTNAQSGPGGGSGNNPSQELVFKNSRLEPGSPAAGTDGAIYRFPSVINNVDALITINGRSSSLVKVTDIDISNTGFDKAFQPEVTYNDGDVNGAKNWWMEFSITFVDKGTTTPTTVNSFYATALDIDGDGNRLHEWDSFYSPSSYTLETNSLLSVSNLMQTILGLLQNVGKTFDGITNAHNGIDTSDTRVMATVKYNSVSTFKFRTGASTTGSSSSTDRMYSIWFKGFTYVQPIVSTLPVKLTSFSAMLNNNSKVDLKWTTATEINVSHFVVERSTDGQNFSDAGVVFANGNTTSLMNYSLSDNITAISSSIVYYRLRSVDIDGKSDISETRIIRISKETGNNISIVTYPNPTSNELHVTIPASWQNKKVAYELFKINGQTANRTETASASQTETLNIAGLAPGLYFVKVTCEGQTAQQKIVKQ